MASQVNRHDLLDRFDAYLRQSQVPNEYLPMYRAAAETFLASFPHLDPWALQGDQVVEHLEAVRRSGATERGLRNLRVVCDALMGFLAYQRERRRGRIQSQPQVARVPSAPPATAEQGTGADPNDRRRFRRVKFLQTVEVDELGRCRSSDLSLGGMYLETVNTAAVGTTLHIKFRLRLDDAQPIVASARVVCEDSNIGFGLEFVAISEGDRRRIERFIR